MSFSPILLLLLSLFTTHASAHPTVGSNVTTVTVLWSWPVGSWAENIAVRRNGELLVTRLDVAELWQVDPRGANASLVHSFSPYTSCVGITELTHDVFAVGVSNFSVPTLSASTGTSSIWTVDVRDYPRRSPVVSLVTAIPEAGLLNGLTTLKSANGTILAADSITGNVYAIDIRTGTYAVVLHDVTTEYPPNASLPLGINGIHIRGEYLYYTNSLRYTLNRVEINPDGTAVGPYEVLYGDSGPLYDDFAISRNDTTYIAQTTSYGLKRVTSSGEGSIILANVNVTLGTAAVAFSRDWKQTLYLVTSGGLAAGLSEPARVVTVDGLQ